LQAAQQGHTGAQNALGYCYKYGQGVPENMPAALIWFRKSAENGNSSGQLNLGDCFRDGVKIQEVTDPDCYTCRYERMCKKHPYTQILAVDIDSAMYWWRKSAEQGNDDAKERLEKIY
jgi:TPR repeat protein